ncbi:hypothetical protein [Streptomyces atacamensis]|uniref:hypothetical protein n=1 Tax=Streptomyces atacamensis TaxID=531966 RepID=UPI00399D10ED
MRGSSPVVRLQETYHRAPAGLTVEEEARLVTEAVARLRAVGYPVDCDEDFATDLRPPRYLPLGAQVAQLAERIRQATTGEKAEILTKLTAPQDGILAAVDAILQATADFHDGMDGAADPYVVRRLRHLADERLHVIRADLLHTRNDLADRHAPHPGRSACVEEVPASERERSAVCAYPPPPRCAGTAPSRCRRAAPLTPPT